ncbi:hypothetical protein FHS19_000285 [Paenibacillus rhizosphaerae]|uniref:Uncharacterized protein n=1 Tax=Paenibacillus rhizosphaerae TaxID=297318 RepID=A0A839TFZ9_9BACL|nr:DUF6220 domain-containing protein [Paenibacillus rhizosphaerae]MBB3125631.1 hypothetical protein [Paenibacillus rhizosphaerae]
MGSSNEKQGKIEANGIGSDSKLGQQFSIGVTGSAPLSIRIRTVRWVYGLLAAGYLACIVVQVFFAGLGILVDPGDLQLHRVFANVFEFVPVVMFLLSFLGNIRGGFRWWPLALFALTALQHITIQNMTGSLRALHAVDALLLFGLSVHLARRSWPWLLGTNQAGKARASGSGEMTS